jgi:precorrin-6B methylase 1
LLTAALRQRAAAGNDNVRFIPSPSAFQACLAKRENNKKALQDSILQRFSS